MQDCHEEIAAYLIKNGCDVNAIDYMGQSALYIACHHGRDEIPINLGRKLVQAGYNFEHDKEWISKDLYKKLTEEKSSFVTKIKRRLSFKKVPRKKKAVDEYSNEIEEKSESTMNGIEENAENENDGHRTHKSKENKSDENADNGTDDITEKRSEEYIEQQ